MLIFMQKKSLAKPKFFSGPSPAKTVHLRGAPKGFCMKLAFSTMKNNQNSSKEKSKNDWKKKALCSPHSVAA